MSEYVTIEVEATHSPDVMELFVNQSLMNDDEDEEIYESPDDGEEGSPIAQMLYGAVDGIQKLVISDDCLTITRQSGVPWESIIDEIRDALRDWFL